MKTKIPLAAVLFGCLSIAACTGGGGGDGGTGSGNPGNLSNDPGEYRPTTPAGIGIAGPMDGTWRVDVSTLLADPRNRNPDLSGASLSLGDTIEFRNGVQYEGDEISDPQTTTSEQNPDPAYTVTPEFFLNERSGDLSFYGFGLALSSATNGPGAVRQCSVFGTTSATTAVAVVVEQLLLTLPVVGGIDRFQVYQVELSKVPTAPVVLAPGD